MNNYRGVGASEGVAVGRVLKIYSAFMHYPRVHLENDDQVARELERIDLARKDTEDQLESISGSSAEIITEEFAQIMASYKLFMRDKKFIPVIINKIATQKINAEWALISVIAELEEQFKKIPDPYIRSRFDDIRMLAERLMNNLQKKPILDLSQLDEPVILVCHDISPADAFHLNKDKVLGIVTEIGGMTSHTTILARAMNIPAVVGLINITTRLKDDAIVIIDGSTGEVIDDPIKEVIDEKLDKQEKLRFQQQKLLELKEAPFVLSDGTPIMIEANLDFLEEMSDIERYHIPAIGLIRTEFMFYVEKGLPDEQDQFELYAKIIKGCEGKPITLRIWDIGSDKTSSIIPELADEVNPALGLRAVRISVKYPEFYSPQIRAIIRASQLGPVRLMIPMITRVDEVLSTKDMILVESHNLGLEIENLQIGCMIETPASIFIIDEMFDLVDFISIGSNDLIQYSLAVDRMNEHVADLFTPFHPAILKMLEQIVTTANRRGKPVSICGELAADPVMQLFLLGVGDITFSMPPNRVLKTKSILSQVDRVFCQKVAFQFLNKHSLAESNLYASQLLSDLQPFG